MESTNSEMPLKSGRERPKSGRERPSKYAREMDAEDPFPLKYDPQMDTEDPLPEMDAEDPFSEMDVEGLFADREVKVETVSEDFKSILSAQRLDFLVRNNNGDEVPISSIEGKMVALYFIGNKYRGGRYCPEFSRILVTVYNDLKAEGKDFEVVLISLDDDEEDDEEYDEKDGDREAYKGGLDGNPFLDIPFKDEIWKRKLARHYKACILPMLVIIAPNGETLNPDAYVLVNQFGIRAYPFTTGRLQALNEIEESWRKSQTLQSLLVYGERDFVIRNDNVKVQVSDLVGKYNLLYFSCQCDFSSHKFLPCLITAYTEMKRKEDFGEVIFISTDSDEESFNTLFKQMPWVALPFGDLRKSVLVDRRFGEFIGTPEIALFGPTGEYVTTGRDVLGLIWHHGHVAYPFTEGVPVSNL